MINMYPFVLLLLSVVLLTASAWFGATRFQQFRGQLEGLKDEYGIIQGATLTLLGLIIGFTFSMAVGRYDQRKNYEEEEANAIGTEYVRADLLPAGDGARVRSLLKDYLDQRILFYTTRDAGRLTQIGATTAKLQAELWSAVTPSALANPNALTGLAVAGMNDVINTQGYTQAAWWNRIPVAAWGLMISLAVVTSMLVGIGTHRRAGFSRLLLVLPLIISIAFFLIADIDSPRRGVIRVAPQNLLALAESLRAT